MSVMNNNRPTFIGIGGHKCASTWTSEVLRYHPEIFVTSPKEPCFFSHHWDKGWNWYHALYDQSESYKARGEFSIYMHYPEALSRMKEHLHDLKIIITIRNPIDRFKSHFMHVARREALKDNLITMDKFNAYTQKYQGLLKNGFYMQEIQSYVEAFGEKQVLVIFKEDIDQTPEKVVSELYSFLEVDANFVPSILDKKVSAGFIPKFQAFEFLRIYIHKKLSKLSPKLINAFKKSGLSEIYRKLNKSNVETKIHDEVIHVLRKMYREDILQLEQYFNRDLSSWK